MRTIPFAVLAVLLLSFTACERADNGDAEPVADTTTDEAPAELTATGDRYQSAWNGNDASAIAAFFTEDAVVTAGDSTFRGRSEIENNWAQNNAPLISDLRRTDHSFEARNGDWHEQGRYEHRLSLPDQEPTQASGRYEIDWTQDADGQWRIRSSDVQMDQAPQDS